MTTPKEPVALLAKCNAQQQQLDIAFSKLSSALSLGAINRFKAQILVLSDWLYSLNEENSDLVLAQAMRFPATFLPHTNQVFCAGIIAAKFCHKFKYHGQHARLVISAALTMNTSLLLSAKPLNDILFKQQLTPEQKKCFQQYPKASAQLLNKYHIIDSAALQLVLNHREVINGSGFPRQLKGAELDTNVRILGLINRFVELISPRAKRSGYKIKQALSFLVKHQHLFDISILNTLIELVDKPLPGFIYKLNKKQYALITHTNALDNQIHCTPFTLEEGQLVLDDCAQHHPWDFQQHYIAPPSFITQRVLNHYLGEYIDAPLEDISDQTQRLKPTEDLTLLLNELSTHLPSKTLISQLIGQQPVLGENLIQYLQSQYPTSKFNSSYHAIQMTGFTQVRPILSRLALDAQLSHFKFANAFNLKQKIDCAVSLSHHISAHFSHVLPAQLAMFTLLNLAPLYLEPRVINGKQNQQYDLDKCHLYHGYSLVGLNNSPKQQKISMALAKVWAPQKVMMKAFTCLVDPQIPQSPADKELISGFELAIYLTHGVFHGVDITTLSFDNKWVAICRDLRLQPKELHALQQLALSNHPVCEL